MSQGCELTIVTPLLDKVDLDALISAVNAGELDPHLAKMGFGSEITPTSK